MKMFLLLIQKNVLQDIRDIKRNSLFIVLPIAIFICFYGYFQLNNVEQNFIKPIEVGIIIEDETMYSQMLIDDFKNQKELSDFFKILEGSEEKMNEAFNKKEIDALVFIPDGFVNALRYFKYRPMEMKIHMDDPVKSMILYNAFQGYEEYISSVEKGVSAFYEGFRDEVPKSIYNNYNDALSIELIMAMINRNDMFKLKPIVDIPATTSSTYYFIALSVMFVFLMSLFTSVGLIKELNSHAFRRILTTKISLQSYLLSKIVSNTILIFIALIFWSVLISFLPNAPWVFNNPKGILLIFSMIFVAVCFSMLVTVFIHSESDMVLLSSLVVFFNAILGGSIIPLHYMPEGLIKLSQITPNYQFIRALLFISNDLAYDNYLSLLLISWVVFVLSFYGLIVGYRHLIGKGSIQ